MKLRPKTEKIVLQSLLFFFVLTLSLLYAQVVSYTEVNVFGWGQAMDRGVPTFQDIDNDGYMDMLVGNNDGYIWHLEQTTGDEFAIIDRKFCEIDVFGEASPTFTNIDNDGLIDLVVGWNSGLEWYEQDAINSNNFIFVSDELISMDPGAHWTPALVDLNNDGLLELIIGESLGTLWYFEQDSINAGTFSLIDDKWLDWDGGTYVHPFFTDLEGDSLLDLLVGVTNGKLYHLVQDDIKSTSFHQVSANFAGIDVGESAAPCAIDVDNDHKIDLFIGEWYNGLYHYEQADSASEDYVLISDQVLGIKDFGYSCGFDICDLDNDGLLDMLVGAYRGADSFIEHFEQKVTGSLNFSLQDKQFNDISIGQYNNLAVHDINGNDLLDLFVCDVFGSVKRYEQDAVNSYLFSLVDEQFNNNMKLNQTAHLSFGYIDEDSLLDMVAGEGNGYLYYYEQDSINAVTFTKQIDQFLGSRFTYYSSPEFTDIDGDSLVDLIVGYSFGFPRYYEQVSPHSLEFSLVTDTFGSAYYGNRTILRFADVNNDGKTDLFALENAGGISLHLRNDDEDVTPPDTPQNLSASVDGNYVNLSWTACFAEDLLLYNIYRSGRNDTAVAEYIYSVDYDLTGYSDSSLTESGKYYYWLTALDLVGNESGFSNVDSVDVTIVGIKDQEGPIFKNFALSQNYPNPFNPVTIITYELPINSHVELSIYNLLGQKVATLVNERQQSGNHTVNWDATGFPSGVYYYQFRTDLGFVQTRKLVLQK